MGLKSIGVATATVSAAATLSIFVGEFVIRSLRWIFLILSIAAIVGVLFWWRSLDGNVAQYVAERSIVAPVDERQRGEGHAESELVAASESATSNKYGGDFIQLKAQAEQGDPVAQRKLAEIYSLCMGYSINPITQIATMDYMARLNPSAGSAIKELKHRLSTRCDQVDMGEIIPLEAYKLWLEQAARNGDLAAKIKLRVLDPTPLSGDEANTLLNATFATKDPQAMFELSELMNRSIEGEIDVRYSRIAGSPLAAVAWGIAACRAGLDCSRGSVMMDSYCMSLWNSCKYSSYEEFALWEIVTKGDQERLNAMINLIQGIN